MFYVVRSVLFVSKEVGTEKNTRPVRCSHRGVVARREKIPRARSCDNGEMIWTPREGSTPSIL